MTILKYPPQNFVVVDGATGLRALEMSIRARKTAAQAWERWQRYRVGSIEEMESSRRYRELIQIAEDWEALLRKYLEMGD